MKGTSHDRRHYRGPSRDRRTLAALLLILALDLLLPPAALSVEAGSVEVKISLGDQLLSEDKVDEAIRSFRAAVRQDPRNATAYQRLGKALSLSGDLEGAQRAAEKAIELDPRNAMAHSNLGWILGMQKRYREAAREEMIAIQLDPENVNAYITLGLALVSIGDYDGAIWANLKALELSPDNLRAYSNLGATLGRKGDYDKAVKVYKEAIELAPRSLTAHLGLGAALGKAGDLKGQIAHFQKAVEIAPNSDNAHGKLGWALYRAGDWQGALREGAITNWLRLHKSGPEFLQRFKYAWAGVFLLFGLIFGVIFLGSRLKPFEDEIVIKSYFLTFYKDRPGRFVITNRRIVFIPEAFSRWFGAEGVSIERDQIAGFDSSATGMRGSLNIKTASGEEYRFTMPNLVRRPLVTELSEAGERARSKEAPAYTISFVSPEELMATDSAFSLADSEPTLPSSHGAAPGKPPESATQDRPGDSPADQASVGDLGAE